MIDLKGWPASLTQADRFGKADFKDTPYQDHGISLLVLRERLPADTRSFFGERKLPVCGGAIAPTREKKKRKSSLDIPGQTCLFSPRLLKKNRTIFS
jgi:hypothetical protein